MPRFFLVHDVNIGRSLAEARRLMAMVDLHRTAIAEEPIALPPNGSSQSDGVDVVEYRPSSLVLRVTTASPSLLVLAESYYPGWRAWVDGRPTAIYRTDMAFRGVVMPPGMHVTKNGVQAANSCCLTGDLDCGGHCVMRDVARANCSSELLISSHISER